MMSNVNVSIIVPVFNAETTIEKCFYYLENQKLNNIEIIYIDDGSTDSSYDLLLKLCKTSLISRAYTQQNSGPSITRNRGIKLARGKYIMFCDSDDYVDSEWCLKLYNAVRQNEVMAMCHMRRIDSNGKILWDSLSLSNLSVGSSMFTVKCENLYEIYKNQLLNSPCNKIYNLNIIKKFKLEFPQNMSLGEDLVFNIAYLSHVNINQVIVVNYVLYNYVLTNNLSLTRKYNPNYFRDQQIIFNGLIKFFGELGIDNDEVTSNLYYDYFYLIINYIDEYINNCQDNIFFKILKVNSILKKDTLILKAFENCKFENDSKLFVFLIKRKNYIYLWLYKKWRNILK